MKKILPEEVLATPACFRQRVSLPAAQVAGLAEAELAAALCFEIEPFSGLSQAVSQLAWKQASTAEAARAVFDVVQIRTTDLAAEVAKARQAKRTVKAVTAVPDAALGEALTDLPWIPVKAARAPGGRLFVCVLVGVLVALGALSWDYAGLRSRERQLLRAVSEQRLLQSEKNRLEAQLQTVRRELQDLQAQRMASARAQQNADVLRSAWRVLLEALTTACRDESVLKEVKARGPYAVHLTGLALSPEAATRTFVRLTDELKPPKSGWRPAPCQLERPAAGGTVVFACDLEFDPEGQFK